MPMRRYLPALLPIALMLTACGGTSPSPSAEGASATASITPRSSSPPPSPTDPTQSPKTTDDTEWVAPVLEAPAGILPPGSVAVVTVDGLRMRGGPPGTGDLHEQIVHTLDAGALVRVGWSPFSYLAADRSTDGRAWYEVGAGGWAASGGEFVGGWVAAGDAGLEFLRLAPVLCPVPINLETLLWTPARGDEPEGITSAWERVACAGNRSLTLEGVFEICYEGGHYPYAFDPAYLAVPDNCANLVLDEIDASGYPSRGGSLPMGIPPSLAGEQPERGNVLRVTGHFDDLASSTCTATPAGDFESDVDPAFLALFCRERFVVETLEVIGHRELAPLP